MTCSACDLNPLFEYEGDIIFGFKTQQALVRKRKMGDFKLMGIVVRQGIPSFLCFLRRNINTGAPIMAVITPTGISPCEGITRDRRSQKNKVRRSAKNAAWHKNPMVRSQGQPENVRNHQPNKTKQSVCLISARADGPGHGIRHRATVSRYRFLFIIRLKKTGCLTAHH